jgi:hypothetical protein
MHMPEDDVGVAPAHSRYRALLDVSAALVEQPTVKAVLHSLREVLSSSLRLHGADLYLLDSGRETLHLLEFDRAVDAPTIRIGTKISRIGAAAQALDQKEPVFPARCIRGNVETSQVGSVCSSIFWQKHLRFSFVCL